ncbi:MAG: YdcF family protein [Parasporobacterium sp.]|nr:YdcF family protein [Parasporobacterium sp.]
MPLRKFLTAALCLVILLSAAGCSDKNGTDLKGTDKAASDKTEEPIRGVDQYTQEEKDLISDMIIYYGFYQDDAKTVIDADMKKLKELNPDAASRWEKIFVYWEYAADSLKINYDVPDDLSKDSNLCFTVLGYKLNPDGTIRDELEGRLKTALECAEKYPKAYIMCTGGGTAQNNPDVTEAGAMAEWLENNGISSDRIIVENTSMTTGQNAINGYNILTENFKEVNEIVIVSSDYHIRWGSVLFEAQCLLNSSKSFNAEVVSNTAFKVEDPESYPFEYQAAGLLEMIGCTDKAYAIYHRQMEKPPLDNITSK